MAHSADRHMTFARCYLNAADGTTYLNIYQSMKAAGYRAGYCRSIGARILETAGIKRALEIVRAEMTETDSVSSPEEVLEAATTQLRMTAKNLVDPITGHLKPLNELSDDEARLIAGFKIKERVLKKDGDNEVVESYREYKLVNPQKTIDFFAKYYGLYGKDNKQRQPKVEKLVVLPSDKELTLAEWQMQIKELNAIDNTAQPLVESDQQNM